MKNKQLFCFIFLLLLSTVSMRVFAEAKGVKPSFVSGYSFVKNQLIVMMFDGPCFHLGSNEQEWLRVQQGMTVQNGDSIRTGSHGYLILSWSDNNMILLKPNTAIRVGIQPDHIPQVNIGTYNGELMLSARNSGFVEINGQHGSFSVNHGEASIISDVEGEIIRSVKGLTAFKNKNKQKIFTIPENYALKITKEGIEEPLTAFDSQTEYHSYRRFEKWLKRFNLVHAKKNLDVNYKIDTVKINDRFLNNLVRQDNGYYSIMGKDGSIPKRIHLQVKISPYPAPEDNFELSLGKDLLYAFRDGRDGYHEVVFEPPTIPDFFITIHSIDSLERRNRIFSTGITVENKRSLVEKARDYCRKLSEAFSRRDQIWLRTNVSRDFRDWQGNSWFDFVNMTEDTMRRYRDIRLILHPFNFEIQNNKILIHLNYRLSALTSDWGFRYEDRGSEIFTLKEEDGKYKLYSKTSGMFFNRLKVAVDLKKGVIRGRITDERTKRPISGVSVTVTGTRYRTTSNSMGEYAFYNLTPGTYNLKFAKNGYGNITATKVRVNPSGEQF